MAWKKRTCSRPSTMDRTSIFLKSCGPSRAWTVRKLFTAGARVRKRLARAALAAYSQCRLFLLRLSVELGCKPIGVPAAPKRAILRC